MMLVLATAAEVGWASTFAGTVVIVAIVIWRNRKSIREIITIILGVEEPEKMDNGARPSIAKLDRRVENIEQQLSDGDQEHQRSIRNLRETDSWADERMNRIETNQRDMRTRLVHLDDHANQHDRWLRRILRHLGIDDPDE